MKDFGTTLDAEVYGRHPALHPVLKKQLDAAFKAAEAEILGLPLPVRVAWEQIWREQWYRQKLNSLYEEVSEAEGRR